MRASLSQAPATDQGVRSFNYERLLSFFFFYVSSLISFTTIQLQMPCPELAAPMFGLALLMGHPNLAVIMVRLFRWAVDQEATPCVHLRVVGG